MKTLKNILLVTLAGLLTFGGMSCSKKPIKSPAPITYDTIPEFNGNIDLGQGIAHFNLYSLVPVKGFNDSTPLATRVLEASPADTSRYLKRTFRLFDDNRDGKIDSMQIAYNQGSGSVDRYNLARLKQEGFQEEFQCFYDGALHVIDEEKRAWEFQQQLQEAAKGIPGVYVMPPIILH